MNWGWHVREHCVHMAANSSSTAIIDTEQCSEPNLNDEMDAVVIVCVTTSQLCVLRNNLIQRQPYRTSNLSGYAWVMEILNGHPGQCKEQLGMHRDIILSLCNNLHNHFGLQ